MLRVPVTKVLEPSRIFVGPRCLRRNPPQVIIAMGASFCHIGTTQPSLKIAVVGFGSFGQFLGRNFVSQGHEVLAYSRSDYSDAAARLGVSFYKDLHEICKEQPEVVVLCTSILSTKAVLRCIPFPALQGSPLFVDVLSVKEFPRNLFLQLLPEEFDILCTHPMFGPVSGKGDWTGLPFVFEKVRVRNDITRCETFLRIFAGQGCKMVEMSCAEHDKCAAKSQFITHTLGRVLQRYGLESTSMINTQGFESLLELVETTTSDSFDLYSGLFLHNNNAMEELERLEFAFQSLKRELMYRKKQLLEGDL